LYLEFLYTIFILPFKILINVMHLGKKATSGKQEVSALRQKVIGPRKDLR
jgi:hypothetical protein